MHHQSPYRGEGGVGSLAPGYHFSLAVISTSMRSPFMGLEQTSNEAQRTERGESPREETIGQMKEQADEKKKKKILTRDAGNLLDLSFFLAARRPLPASYDCYYKRPPSSRLEIKTPFFGIGHNERMREVKFAPHTRRPASNAKSSALFLAKGPLDQTKQTANTSAANAGAAFIFLRSRRFWSFCDRHVLKMETIQKSKSR